MNKCVFVFSVIATILQGREAAVVLSAKKPVTLGPTFVESECGKVNSKYTNGNTQSVSGEWPWHVSILVSPTKCTNPLPLDRSVAYGAGSLINKQWILTASHLFTTQQKSIDSICVVVVLGSTTVTPSNENAKAFIVDKIVLHPQHGKRTTFDYDAALVQIGKPVKLVGKAWIVDEYAVSGEVQFNDFIRPVCLPCLNECGVNTAATIPTDEKCKTWGRTLSEMSSPKIGVKSIMTGINMKNPKTIEKNYLEKDVLQIMSENRCILLQLSISKSIFYTDSMICTEGTRPDAPCLGTGGSALVKELTIAGKSCWVQLGIVSFGGECGKLSPTFYTDVSALRFWIKSTI